jgi:uncharacterized delta-60 repeat protein
MKKVFLSLAFLGFIQVAFGQDGTLDLMFGTNGRVKSSMSIGSTFDFSQAVVIQPDGKIIVAGVSISSDPFFLNTSKIGLIRYQINGKIDSTFGTNGRVLTSFSVDNLITNSTSMALQTDGKIVVGGAVSGNPDLSGLVLRYTTNGVLDTTFNRNGGVVIRFGAGGIDQIQSLIIQSDGKILVAGASDSRSFPTEQGFYRIALARLNPNGGLDSTFNATGKVITRLSVTKNNIARSIAVQSDNKIVICGNESINELTLNFQIDRLIVRYNSNGLIDTTFGSKGIIQEKNGQAKRVEILSNGKILVGGSEGLNSFALFRYNVNGAVDASFGNNGKSVAILGNKTNEMTDMLVQKDGKIVLSGTTSDSVSNILDFALVRFLDNGTLDNFFGTNGKVRISTFTSQQQNVKMAIQNDSKLVIAGATDNSFGLAYAVLRFNNRLGTKVATIPKSFNVKCYPNPTQNELNIDLNDAIHSNFSLRISDLTGRIVYQNKYDKALINNTLKINIGDLISGLYVVTIQSEKEIMSQLISKN